MSRRVHWPALAVVCCVAVSGCGSISLPTQSHPICSWSTTPPANAGADCRAVFTSLHGLAIAVSRRDRAAIERVATNQGVAHRIEAYAARLHEAGASGLHIVPSVTVNVTVQGWVGADFLLLGNARIDKVKSENIVYFTVRRGHAYIVADEAGEDF